MKIWISYSSEDLSFAKKLKDKFTEIGNDCALIDGNVVIGENILNKLTHLINNSDVFLVIFSKSSEKSNWFNSELLIILNEITSKKNKKILIPIILDKNIKLPPIIDQIAYADFSDENNFDVIFKHLNDILNIRSEQNLVNTEINLDSLLKEKKKILELEKLDYEIYKKKSEQLKNFTRFTIIISTVIPIVLFLYLLIKDGDFVQKLDFYNIIFYLLGILTMTYPLIYLLMKKNK